MRQFLSGLLLLLLISSPAWAQENGPPIRHLAPATPDTLLRVLSGTTDKPGWNLTRSEARTWYTDHLKSRAVRVFTQLQSQQQIEDGIKPWVIEVTLLDTAGDDRPIQIFKLHEREEGSEDTETMEDVADVIPGHWKYHSAVLVEHHADQRQSVRVLIEDRFIIQVIFPGRDYRIVKSWLEAMELNVLVVVQEQEIEAEPEFHEIQHVNELRPEQSRSYRVAVSRDSTIEQIRNLTAEGYREAGIRFPQKPTEEETEE